MNTGCNFASLAARSIRLIATAVLLALHLDSALAQSNPPSITSLSPNFATAGGPAFTMTVTGANFNRTTTVRWNGANQPTTFISTNQLAVEVAAVHIATPGIAKITSSDARGSSNAVAFTIHQAYRPAPVVHGLDPGSATAGGPQFRLVINGANFTRNSIVKWNGASRPAGFISSQQLSAEIPASYISAPGTASVSVFDSESGSSKALPFTITQVTPPAAPPPVIAGINPGSAPAGSPGVTLTITGANFGRSSIVRFNGANRPTGFLSPNQLTVAIPASDLAAAGAASVVVIEPAGGSSNAFTFTITSAASPRPSITSLTPNSIPAGGKRVQLIVSGAAFAPNSVVQLNGSGLPTTFISPSQLIAVLPALATQLPVSASITVVNPSGERSNAMPLNITAQAPSLPHPVLTSISSSAVAQGARQTRLVLVGSNFKQGASVIISKSAGSFAGSADVAVESVARIDDKTMVAVVSIAGRAEAGLRFVDVINPDSTNTGPGGSRTSGRLFIQSASSLASPLAIRSLAVTQPRSGAVVARGEEIFAEAILSGAGTGTITGQWVWDGNVIEQFAVAMTGGERVRVRSSGCLPTGVIGPHTLELRVTNPGSLASPAVQIVINPGGWRLLRLLAPAAGAGFKPGQPPLLRWALVPGAAKYQVGFSARPSPRAIKKWHDAEDAEWQVPEEIWSKWPEGEFYWTVRVIESSGVPRQPAQMRLIIKSPGEATPPGVIVTSDANGVISLPNDDGDGGLAEGIGSSSLPPSEQIKDGAAIASAHHHHAGAEADDRAAPATVASEAEAGFARQLNYEVGLNTQVVSGKLAGTSVLSVAAQSSLHRGPWRVEMNGSGLLNLLIHPQPRQAIGQFNDYVFRVGYGKKKAAADVRFGTLAPQALAGAEFITLSIPQQAVEASLRMPAGAFSLYTDAGRPGSGAAGALQQKQAVRAASYQAPLPAERATFRLMWLGAKDSTNTAQTGFDFTGGNAPAFDAFGAPASGDVFAGVLSMNLGESWQWVSEFSHSANRFNAPFADSFYGKAFRSGVALNRPGMTFSLTYRDVSPDFAAPSDASLGQMSASDRRGLDAAVMKQTGVGAFTANYQFLESDRRSDERPTTSLHNATLGWAKNVTAATTLVVSGTGARTAAGRRGETGLPGELGNLPGNRVDQLRTGLNLSVTQMVGKLSLTAVGMRNWFEDRTNRSQNNITSSFSVSGNWNPLAFFQLQSNASVNWTAGNRTSAGGTRVITVYLQPTLVWQSRRLTITPLATINHLHAQIGSLMLSNTMARQYSSRISWQMPGPLQFSSLSLEASRAATIDRLHGTTVMTPRIVFLWTIVRSSKAAP